MVGVILKYGILFAIPAYTITIIVNLLIMRRKKIGLTDVLYRCLFIAYCCFLLSAIFVGRPHIRGAMLVPFSSYYEAWVTKSFVAWRNILLNIAMFIPFGVLFPISWNKEIKIKHFVLIVCAVSLSMEMVQYVSNTGVFEVDDLINNLLGSLFGNLVWRKLKQK